MVMILTMRNVLTDLVHSHVEAGHNDAAADSGGHGGLLAEDEVGEEHVEHGGETPPDVVEGDPHVLEAEVVEGDHADEHQGERQHAPHGGGLQLQLGEGDAAGELPGELPQHAARRHRDQALVPGHEQGRLQPGQSEGSTGVT